MARAGVEQNQNKTKMTEIEDGFIHKKCKQKLKPLNLERFCLSAIKINPSDCVKFEIINMVNKRNFVLYPP